MQYVICVLCLSLIVIPYYFYKREQKLLASLQKMLDDAVAGKFKDYHLYETGLSVIENSLWHYICGKELSYQRVLKEKEKIQSLVSDIAHQTVTPVSNIILYTQLLEERMAELHLEETVLQPASEEISAVTEQAKKLDFLIQSLVKLSRLETGTILVNAKKHDIRELLLCIKQQFMPKAEQKGLHFEIKETSGFAVFDSKWTTEAVGNLVDNAIKYTSAGGTVFIRTENYASFLRIDIIDSGIGIKEEEQGNIFQRFYRSAEVSQKPGLGLGLYLAREVIKAQNGFIKVKSVPMQGSTFSVFLLKGK